MSNEENKPEFRDLDFTYGLTSYGNHSGAWNKIERIKEKEESRRNPWLGAAFWIITFLVIFFITVR